MPPYILETFIAMIGPLRAQRSIQLAEAAFYSAADKNGRRKMMNMWRAQVLGMAPDKRRTHDEYGRLILRSSNELRAWFGLGGHSI